jgi:alkaline phosphatase D
MNSTQLPVDRRTLLAASAVGAAGVTLGAAAVSEAEAATRYFRHGVASGDPRPRSVILWTRVTPTENATPGSGNGPRVTVTWQVAKDASFRNVVSRGTFRTGPARDHTVKLDATGLSPATRYFYRFLLNGVASPVGRTKTAPAPNADNKSLRFGVVSCSNIPAGFFSAYRHLAARTDLDAVLHLGDYLYEYGNGEYGSVRDHEPPHEMVSLADYRQRHAQYKTDPDLQKLHLTFPFIVTWDDHEVTNDQWRAGAENHQPEMEGDYFDRRARAHKAYDEWMPVRMGRKTDLGDGTRLFRRLKFGKLAELSMLDLRTYRSEQVALAQSPAPSPDPEISDRDRTITGNRQMEWLKESLREDRAVWKLIGNPVMIAPVVFPPLPNDITGPLNDMVGLLPPAGSIPEDGAPYNVDQWDGYTADRRELFRHIRNHGVNNTVFLTGDIHSAWACDLPVDAGTYLPTTGESVGTEFVCTSVTSDNLDEITGSPRRTISVGVETFIKANNRHIRYLNFDDHGFSVLEVTRRHVQMDYYAISDRTDPNATAHRQRSWRTMTNSQKVRPEKNGIDG